MTTKDFQLSKVHLFHYFIASADMYYTEEGQCDVFLGENENGQISIWGQTAECDLSARINLCEVFLEYGLYCSTWCSTADAYRQMQGFGERLGHGLAKDLQGNPILRKSDNPALYALERVFKSIGVDFSEDSLERGVRLRVARCPVQRAAKRSGLLQVELARHGINAMCRSLLLDINPHLIVEISPDSLPEFIFSITLAESG